MAQRGTDGRGPNPTGTGRESQLLLDFDQLVAPTAVASSLTHDHPESRFALRFAALLEADPVAAFDNPALSQLAREILGSSAGHARDAYDAAEAGFNIHLNRLGLELGNVRSVMETLITEQARMPRQTRRDDVQVEFQQFSTPPALALVVVAAAALRCGMTVLEPSAGTGNMAVLARLAGAEVDTNEIDEPRRSLLVLQGFSPTAFDAERLDNLLPPDKFYDAIVMNPPFSATGGRVRGHSTEFGARHVEQALLRLKPGGRLVAIVGRGMALDRPTFRAWWADVEVRYRVRANIGMDGNEYAKFGTTFDNQIIVIDHDGPTASETDIITGSGLSVHAAFELLWNLSQEDVYGRIRGYGERAGASRLADDVPPGSPAGDGPAPRTHGVPPGRWGRGHPIAIRRDGDNGTVAQLESPRVGPPTGPVADDDAGVGKRTDRASHGN